MIIKNNRIPSSSTTTTATSNVQPKPTAASKINVAKEEVKNLDSKYRPPSSK
jgi:hypothetical protein